MGITSFAINCLGVCSAWLCLAQLGFNHALSNVLLGLNLAQPGLLGLGSAQLAVQATASSTIYSSISSSILSYSFISSSIFVYNIVLIILQYTQSY
jgi:hypothetical protein